MKSMLMEAKYIAKRKGKIWCNDIHNCCKKLCFCSELEQEWESLTDAPLPYCLQLVRKHKATYTDKAALPFASAESGVYSNNVSISLYGIHYSDNALPSC